MVKGKRSRDAGTGKLVTSDEAMARPKETVTEDASKPSLEKRVALLESVLEEDGGRLSDLYRRRKRRG